MDNNQELEIFKEDFIKYLKQTFCSPYKVDGNKVSRNEYAEKSGISRGTLSRLNEGAGYDVPLSTIYKLCKFEDITPKDLFEKFEKYSSLKV
ncbi:helix-turn-helix transcriptional regulator [Sphingobacterium sp. UME9]|uniref:helix-turn-helix domain-containing protein n=1 Tax=Sphingobacterium sp. UME9 TaxID=1862316 RepID=UPI001601DF13|nr:helix-turn-helix transcriptional regulator [Sphingobacterium sp. UME9]MBB1643621.1 hypothetical protein [Sphingobacterium sp. UME9]